MKAIIYGFGKNDGRLYDGVARALCVYFPEAEIVSVTDHSMVLYDAKTYRDLEFFQLDPERKICEFDVPFDLIARIYCLFKDYGPKTLENADNIVWNELVKEQLQIVSEKKREKERTDKFARRLDQAGLDFPELECGPQGSFPPGAP